MTTWIPGAEPKAEHESIPLLMPSMARAPKLRKKPKPETLPGWKYEVYKPELHNKLGNVNHY